tara:strand:+ start:2251 stop:2421 length:171 start_codon:yes stop_codon:yes gene_type:complete
MQEADISQYHSLQKKYDERGIGLNTALDLLEKANEKLKDYRKEIHELKEELKSHAK